jgi:broad specificity phosphatase PhoE
VNESHLAVVFTVRHSATAHNAAQVITGRLDEPLSHEGRALAHEARDRVGPIDADLAISSPMRRAIDTAVIMTGRAEAEIVLDELCLERDYGLLQGLDGEQVRQYAARVDYVEVGGIRHSLNPPGGETFEQVRRRAVAFYEALRSRPARSAIVFSHQVFLQQLHGLLLDLDVVRSLALDIRTLQVDRFRVDAGLPAEHVLIDPGIQRFRSW